MAPTIIPLAIEPAFSATDAELASRYVGYDFQTGRWSDPDDVVFYFRYADGNSDHFSPAELRRMTWWRAMPLDVVLSIESFLYPTAYEEEAFYYVARYDRAAGQKLVPGSRLSAYFGGPTRADEANRACAALRLQHSDAGVFRTNAIEEAERLLHATNPKESTLMREERMAVARFSRDIANFAGVQP